MSEHPGGGETATAGTDDATAPPVTVRLTESATDADPFVGVLYDVDATLAFRSVAAAYAFENRLNDAAADSHEYQLTPDHRTDATFFLRCQRVDR